MTDKEILFMAYGALKAAQTVEGGVNFEVIIAFIEDHLFLRKTDEKVAPKFPGHVGSEL